MWIRNIMRKCWFFTVKNELVLRFSIFIAQNEIKTQVTKHSWRYSQDSRRGRIIISVRAWFIKRCRPENGQNFQVISKMEDLVQSVLNWIPAGAATQNDASVFKWLSLVILGVIRHEKGQMNSSIPILNSVMADYYLNNGHNEEARQLFERLVSET